MPPETPEAEPTLRESLDAAVTVVEDGETPGLVDERMPDKDVPEPKDAPGAPEITPPAPGDNRARGPDGKFAPRPKEAAGRTDTSGTTDTPPHLTKPAPTAAEAAPVAWKQEVKPLWDKLPPEVRAEVSRREKEISTGLHRAHGAVDFANTMMEEFRPYEQILRQEGASPQMALRTLLETAYTLRHGSSAHKHALFLSMAEQYGIDLKAQVSPELARAQWEADSLKHQQMRGQTGQEAQVVNEIQDELQQFSEAPGHEHYDAVRMHMAAMLSNGTAKDLQDAYDQAVWANPETRKAAMEQQITQQNAQRAAAAGKNRNATLAVSGAPGSVSVDSAVDPKNLRGVIEAAFAKERM